MSPSTLLNLLGSGLETAVVAWDDARSVCFWSQGAEALYGLAREEAMSLEWPCVPREGLPLEVITRTARISGGWQAVERRRSAAGQEIAVACTVRYVAAGGDSLFVETSTDTAQQRSEVLLRESEARLARLLEQAPEGLLLCDAEGKLRFANRSACRRLGWETAPLGEALPHPLAASVARVLRTHEAAPLGPDHGLTGSVRPFEGPTGGVVVSLPDAEAARCFATDRAERDWLEGLSRRLLQAREMERRELARELHDEVGQQLTALRQRLEAGDTPAALEEVEGLMARVRQLSLELRPALLDDLGLVPALLWLCDRSGERGLPVRFQHRGVSGRFGADVETAAYRVVQEALTNAARHSGASVVDLKAVCSGTWLTLAVADTGKGFDPDRRAGGAGLSGMADRVRLLGGSLRVDSAPGAGTRIEVKLPLLSPRGVQE